jgi:F0F1-type ATP synthase alpha subunit
LVVFAGTRGLADQFKVGQLMDWERGLLEFFEAKHADLLAKLESGAKIEAALDKELRAAVEEFNIGFRAERESK